MYVVWKYVYFGDYVNRFSQKNQSITKKLSFVALQLHETAEGRLVGWGQYSHCHEFVICCEIVNGY